MGKRSRRRADAAQAPAAPESSYESPDGDATLHLRAVLTPRTRREYAAIGGAREDAWQRRVEFLFERLAVRWDIAGTEPIARQRELLERYRFASSDERAWIRDALRSHLAEWFPDVEAP